MEVVGARVQLSLPDEVCTTAAHACPTHLVLRLVRLDPSRPAFKKEIGPDPASGFGQVRDSG